jgi:hypothetical protein
LKNVSVEQVLILFIFVLLPLLNWLLRRLGRRRERQAPLPPYRPEVRRQATVSEPDIPPPEPTQLRVQAQEAAPAPAAVRRSRISTSSLFRTKAEMRRAIILMSILGPCRAADPAEKRDSNAFGGGDDQVSSRGANTART